MGTNNKKKINQIKSNKNQIENILKWSQPKFVLIKHSVKDTESGNTNLILAMAAIILQSFHSANLQALIM